MGQDPGPPVFRPVMEIPESKEDHQEADHSLHPGATRQQRDATVGGVSERDEEDEIEEQLERRGRWRMLPRSRDGWRRGDHARYD